MSAPPENPYGPLVPLPELTPEGLRTAVARIAPGQVPALTQHLFEAATNAQRIGSLAPLRTFVHAWAVFVAVQRHPERAARPRALEDLVTAGEKDPGEAIAEIIRIRATAERETGLCGVRVPRAVE
ncbi:hypothetical protein ACFVIM_17515 [Streptomyces sp. NPDC057638]|uniref:hypothetical protein n=1 Tax=Streptomyces sp. NPDC057638 TaxID=3346190 RepID=UPI0036B61D80